ncbi:MAG: tetratricopeptide repeat protein [Hyphomonadaceae bacterium]
MRKLIYLLFVVAFAAAPGHAQQPAHPWEVDQRLFDDASSAVQSGGILALKPKLADLEQALAGAPHAFEVAARGEGDTHYVLTDGAADTLGALAGATLDGAKGTTVAVNNPYLSIAFYLGSYYNEIGRHEDSARALAAGLALPDLMGLGELRPMLLVEQGAALGALRRLDEAMASYEEALAIPGVDDQTRAYMMRGRGGILIDLERLDEAEASFRESLKLAPDSAVAKNELQYIANLRAGKSTSGTVMTKVQPQN